MIQCFTKKTFTSSFASSKMPHLLSASYITIDFSQHSRILHNHPDRLELLFVRTGTGSYIVGDECYDIESGDIVVCNCGILHDELAQNNKGLSMLSIAIDNLQLTGLPENHLIPDNIKPVLKAERHFALIDTIFQSIFDLLAFEFEEQPETVHYLTYSLLSLLIHAFGQYGQPLQDNLKEHPLLKDIKCYIDENYSENLSLKKISDHFYVSPSYLSHLFKKKMGYSPMHYIVRRRIGEAQSMLIMSSSPIADIASAVGFDNLTHFNLQFKKYVGLSPSTYRKRYTLPDHNILQDNSEQSEKTDK